MNKCLYNCTFQMLDSVVFTYRTVAYKTPYYYQQSELFTLAPLYYSQVRRKLMV